MAIQQPLFFTTPPCKEMLPGLGGTQLTASTFSARSRFFPALLSSRMLKSSLNFTEIKDIINRTKT